MPFTVRVMGRESLLSPPSLVLDAVSSDVRAKELLLVAGKMTIQEVIYKVPQDARLSVIEKVCDPTVLWEPGMKYAKPKASPQQNIGLEGVPLGDPEAEKPPRRATGGRGGVGRRGRGRGSGAQQLVAHVRRQRALQAILDGMVEDEEEAPPEVGGDGEGDLFGEIREGSDSQAAQDFIEHIVGGSDDTGELSANNDFKQAVSENLGEFAEMYLASLESAAEDATCPEGCIVEALAHDDDTGVVDAVLKPRSWRRRWLLMATEAPSPPAVCLRAHPARRCLRRWSRRCLLLLLGTSPRQANKTDRKRTSWQM